MFSILEAAIKNEYLGTDDLVLVRMIEQQSLLLKQEKELQESKQQHEKLDLEKAVQKEARNEPAEEQHEERKSQHSEESLEQEVSLESEGAPESSDTEDQPTISYSFAEEQLLMEQFYNSIQLNYESSWYKQSRSSLFESEEEYQAAENEFYDTEAEILTTEEAEEALIEIQYAAVSGTPHEVDSETRRKFDMWIKFNPALFRLFEASYSLTRNVDYRPLA